MAVCNYLLDGWLCGTRTPDGADKCTSHGGLTAHESDKARAILKTARTSSAVEGITKPFDGDAMAEIVAKAYPPAIFPGDATS